MTSFRCVICGLGHSEEERANPGWNYGKGCWNHYQRMRRAHLKARKNFSMAIYKTLRKKEGLPTLGMELVRRGRPLGHKSGQYACEACGAQTDTRLRSPDDRICQLCYNDWGKHQKNAPDLDLRLDVYILFRKSNLLLKYEDNKPLLKWQLQEQYREISRFMKAVADGIVKLE
jgi:hypothetical protein